MSNLERFLDALGGGSSRSAPRNDVYMPDWSMVTRKAEVLGEMRSSGESMATHACTCTANDCALLFTHEPTWLTPKYFRQYVTYMLEEATKSVDPRNKEAGVVLDEVMIYLAQWSSMTEEQIVKDPRYCAFQCGFNNKLLAFIIQHHSFRVPVH